MIPEIFLSMINFLLEFINQAGYFGIFIGMTIESSLFPFPSEVILIPAGALVAMGEMSFLPVLIAALLGSIVGALFNYFLAFFLGRITIDILVKKYGRFILIDEKKLRKSDMFFEKHGEVTTFIGRLIPVIRQLISLPAGFSKMNLSKFCLFTIIGSGTWAIFLISVGYFFGSSISSELKLVITLITLVISAIVLLIYFRKRNNN